MGNLNYIKVNYINYYITCKWFKNSNQNVALIRLDLIKQTNYMLSVRETLQIQGCNYIECENVETDMNPKSSHERAGVTILTSGKIDSTTKAITRYKEKRFK